MAAGKKHGGRKKGTLNKVNSDIKAMVLEALEETGGVDYLVMCSKEQPVAFLGLVGKVLPLTIKADVQAEVGGKWVVEFVNAPSGK